ncbi:hypothetical protein BHE74_00051748, partial [Ensete ventricosum]
KGNEERGRSAIAKPSTGAASDDQAPIGSATSCQGHQQGQLPPLACKGRRLPTARPEGRHLQALRLQELSPEGNGARPPTEGSTACRRGSRPWAGRPPAARSTAATQGQQRPTRRGQEGVPRRYVSHLQSIISLFILVHHRLAKLLHRLGRRYAVCAGFPPDMADSFPFECAQELPSLRWDLCLFTTIFNRLCMLVGPSWCGIDPSVGLFRVRVVATLKAVSIEISWTSGDEVAARAAGPAGPLHPLETELPMMSTRY